MDSRKADVDTKRQMKILQEKMRTLEQLLHTKSVENSQLKSLIENSELQTIKTLNDQLASMKKEKEQLLQSIEREEENITNALRQKMTEKIREKVDLENTLEAEQEMMFNAMTKQLAQNITERIAFQRKVEAEHRSRSISDVESTKECESLDDIFTDSSISSDTDSLREAEEDQRKQKLLEIELLELKRQRKAAKHEMLRYKELYESLESSHRQLLSEMAGKRPGHRHGESDPRLSADRMNRSMEIHEADSNPGSLNTSQELSSHYRGRAASMTKQS